MNYKPIISSAGGTVTGLSEIVVDWSPVEDLFNSGLVIVSGIILYFLTSWFDKLKKKNGRGN